MTRPERFLGWLESASDWLSPIVVKEVRQAVRGRQFVYSFGASLVAGLVVAFGGAADALTGTGTAGRWTFGALTGCLAFLGLAVVPIGAFSALRIERIEQTLELITLTALTPRRVVIGKLVAQGVKLATLFAAVAPFIAMSFLLGGVDFTTILISLAVLFIWSLWMCSACLFFSSLFKSWAAIGLVVGGGGIVLLLILGLGRMLFLLALRGGISGSAFVFGFTGAEPWWALAIMTTFCLVSMANLVLLAENRLSLATTNRVTPLRVGFLAQFLLITAWALSFINEAPAVRSNALEALNVIGGLHLALVAMFTVTEDLVVPRRVLSAMASSRWRSVLAIFQPGGGRGAAYVLAQMALLVAASWLMQATWPQLRWLLAMCGYICFFTGVPTCAFRIASPATPASLRLRVAVLVLLPVSMLFPDILYYVLWQPGVLDLSYGTRHLLDPIRTLANWHTVETAEWLVVPFGLGLVGFLSYAALILIGRNMTAQVAPTDPEGSAAIAGAPGRANVLY
ncbi:MAG TPA: hypothetical protein VLD67_11075 [Vicinamibacterales bacterium]|nr:hypothetical protein [Vicinamibacterales bacterium]